MKNSINTGLLDIEYAKGREEKRSLRYRLQRRAHEVLSAIEEFSYSPVKDIIDLGTAEGKMLDIIKQKLPRTHCVGVEYNKELIEFGKNKYPNIEFFQGDIQSLDFTDNSFDVVMATAVIEHVPDPLKALKEAKRILRPKGILILTSPDPFWEHLATIVGHLKDDQHNFVMNLHQLSQLSKDAGLTVLKTQKFMLSPIGMPFEFEIERFVRKLHLNILFANQLLIAQC